MINALFVCHNGPYYGLPEILPFSIVENAFSCKNGAPAIAHPPCERWGRYWSGGPSVKVKKLLGDDGGCFAFSLWYVRTFGGVIEHPEASHAFKYYGLPLPPRKGGWTKEDVYGGSSCCVEQGHYGHKARKATWLYSVKTKRPDLKWGPSQKGLRLDEGFHSAQEAREKRAHPDFIPIKRLSAHERVFTPIPFRDLLIDLIKG